MNVAVIEAGVWQKVDFWHSCLPMRRLRTAASANSWSETSGQPLRSKRCIALDDLVESIPLPDAIKCDVEGAEAEALRGADKLLRSRRRWIICEMH
jgi:FkbM family methyltransferase